MKWRPGTEMSLLERFNLFGCDQDVFDNFREAVDHNNRDTLKVLSILAAGISFATLAIQAFRPMDGTMLLSFAALLVALMGVKTAFTRDSERTHILRSFYSVSITLYVLAIYLALNTGNEVYYVGIALGISGYVLDYAWKGLTIQILAYGALVGLSLSGVGKGAGFNLPLDGLFTVFAMVTFWFSVRTRLSLVLRREESQLQADTDRLTGLTIRATAEAEIERLLTMTPEPGVLMLLDLDRFKSVNDTLGHQKGDEVLISVAADLKRMFRATDVLSRLGGDEFIVYLTNVPEPEWAVQRADQVLRAIRRWVSDGVTSIQITASVGIVMTSEVKRAYTDLYRAADIAMYLAKSRGGNQAVVYSADLLHNTAETTRATTRPEARTLADEQMQNTEEGE